MESRSIPVVAASLARVPFLQGRIRSSDDVAFVVFSRNRPLQLEALLRSAAKYVSGHAQWRVLWRADTPAYRSAYKEVLAHAGLGGEIPAVEEIDFRRDLIAVLGALQTRGLIFLVDDLIFRRAFDLHNLSGIHPSRALASMRLGAEIEYCQPKNENSLPPVLKPWRGSVWLQFSWREARGDWSMPVSLDGHLFGREELLWLLRRISFRAPNSLEAALGAYRFLFKFRRGLCLQEPVILNLAFNRAQTEIQDFPCGTAGLEDMLERWESGFRLNLDALSKIEAKACHVVTEPVFEPRPGFGR